jgi:hypothetical protein
LVTRFGVSVENVVATMLTPTSHHGALRPDVKNSAVLDPARLARITAGRNDTTIETRTMIQSRVTRRMLGSRRRENGCTASPRRTSGLGANRKTR